MARRSEEQVPRHILRHRPLRQRQLVAAAALVVSAVLPTVLWGCAAGSLGSGDRYPEEKRPDAPRSASDGEVLGAQRQDPSDTLEGSLTNEHGAPTSPHAEESEAEAAHEQLDYEDCIEAEKAAANPAPGAEGRRRPVCPPPPESAD
jgi:hypothetical protein